MPLAAKLSANAPRCCRSSGSVIGDRVATPAGRQRRGWRPGGGPGGERRKRLGAADFLDQMAVDIDQACAVAEIGHDMRVPNLVEQGARACDVATGDVVAGHATATPRSGRQAAECHRSKSKEGSTGDAPVLNALIGSVTVGSGGGGAALLYQLPADCDRNSRARARTLFSISVAVPGATALSVHWPRVMTWRKMETLMPSARSWRPRI